jgi:hypothetical protein
MKQQDANQRKTNRAVARLPKGVVLKAAERVGLTRADFCSTAELVLAGLTSRFGGR